MWSIEQLEAIRDDCIKDIIDIFPNLEDEISKQRIEVNLRRTSTMARYSTKFIEISAYLLSSSTSKVLLQTIIMKGILRGQLRLQESDLEFEQTVWLLQDRHAEKYDFKDFRDYYKHHVEKPLSKETYKYAVRCPECGQMFYYKRMCKTVMNPQEYFCTNCWVSLERV